MTGELRYLLMDPSGNRTILVESPVPEAEQPAVAERLLALEPSAEQVGFLTRCDASGVALRMAGGEFCGNAAMSAAVYYALQNSLTGGTVSVDISGAPSPLAVTIDRDRTGLWRGRVAMPRPVSIQSITFPNGQTLPVVFFLGIAHVILRSSMSRSEAEKTVVAWCDFLKAEALGLMFVDPLEERLTPLVYVPAVNSLYWENACGSGISAVGAWLAAEKGTLVHIALRQPGGILEVDADPSGSLLLQGTVRLRYAKTVHL
ncbi:MAG: hypothetical protein K6A77_08055 [Clostridiales bacterium]|nr:hypothetical protein [Clostridiales bacterium]